MSSKKKIDLKRCIAVTSGNYFEKNGKGGWKVRDCYIDKPAAKIDKSTFNIVTSTRKDKKVYLGDFSSLQQKVKGYAIDRLFNHGEKNSKSIYLVEVEVPEKKSLTSRENKK